MSTETNIIPGPIPQLGLEHLKAHKYASSEYTPIDNLMNDNFWTPLVPYIPLVFFAVFVYKKVGCSKFNYSNRKHNLILFYLRYSIL